MTLGYFSGSGPTEKEVDRVIKVHRQVGDYAQAAGITMAIEAFSRALPQLAAATRIWRDLSPSLDEVWKEGFNLDPPRVGHRLMLLKGL